MPLPQKAMWTRRPPMRRTSRPPSTGHLFNAVRAHLDFLAVAASMEGRYGRRNEASNKLIDFTRPVVKEMPMFEPVLATSMLIQIRFQNGTSC